MSLSWVTVQPCSRTGTLAPGADPVRKGLTYRDTVVLNTPEPQHSDREDVHHG